ncbi:MAG: bifunctional phosphoribosylaminoimidazolecarboxamide formyltransferase/IMP cyclohydrolase [Candidatus Magasanikbacteria bacterium RIFCSPHIGHO2_01_FULL_33_34]|uniref:Bifunctional purine biosynthesis protein PurH n=1 Tax=Candidatus Magasanikbacteria bacterium RIFCSPHIGHO2_01_FULL_33_34 TaxID=1798671 RepID=A0A1F6LHD8_9BACT|nr:MAG: bifunctional phosphoribosylaminoimidazolecarboxamide formyltransferase/IMP cyclohydrolase [Candidatus Magasanikbacteria bacterium RIFCSPHIGHO2_01_FULL_33_34]OGH65088.1 MAG: bifunctional phosphoribosylaminoimidazolecarboxamide formyltransferase/IMP cyclohydrolase [Candidatus Magasanikbacteria bacterium RIFCSPHIGHO2_02_FULL_33_17]OGH75368.1 MAG: bifunctional phosphoribosylaminoimidazolecarboxamide formyltransferase/IMP cyclohydrolase [Candidatus Magasanikbacteria bacterium RIFCSPLOWO2_01_FU
MNKNSTQIHRALISVSNKDGILEFAKELQRLGIEIISTGGTAKKLTEANINVKDISEFTGFPEMMEGRVKTLHPKVHGGILGLRDSHKVIAEQNEIKWIDLVVCNLYPFSETILKENVNYDEIIENIDIGGPTMIRSAAKNMGWVTVIVDPQDYNPLLEELKSGGINFETRKKMAIKSFGHTAQYDTIIHNHLKEEKFSYNFSLTFKKDYELRYGENPHQMASVYKKPNNKGCNILNAKILQGKKLSYNNINDADGALSTLKEFTEPACVIVKHANPCGVAIGDNIATVFKQAYNTDPMSAFGGIIALNRTCTKAIAEEITKVFVEIVLAPNYDKEALGVLDKKQNMRVLELGNILPNQDKLEFRYIEGGLLVQDIDTKIIKKEDLQFVTDKQPTEQELIDMLFGWKVLKHVKSNAILIAKNNTTIGIGPGQVSRIDAVDLAIKKSGEKIKDSVLCSDAFFPFRDSIDKIAQTGIKAIIQPGGSIKDEEVIKACNEYKISMVFTGNRCFKH